MGKKRFLPRDAKGRFVKVTFLARIWNFLKGLFK